MSKIHTDTDIEKPKIKPRAVPSLSCAENESEKRREKMCELADAARGQGISSLFFLSCL